MTGPDLFRMTRWLIAWAIVATCSAAAADYRFDDVERVVAVGDVHGAYPELVGVLREAEIVDENLAWIGGEAHLVSLGDLVDRGAESRRVIDLLRGLVDQARAAGGDVHVLLGNHEVMNLTRDLRYLDAEEPAQYAEFDPSGEGNGMRGHAAAFASDGEYGRWLLERPFVIVINDSVFVHGGISEALLGYSLDEINRGAAQALHGFVDNFEALVAAGLIASDADFDGILTGARTVAESEDVDPAHVAAATRILESTRGLPFHPDGPLWYRGNALCHPYYEQDTVEEALAQWDARRIVVAHSTTSDGRPHKRMDGQVVRIDTGLNTGYYGGTPTALEIIAGNTRPIGPPGLEFVVESHRNWDRPYGMSDEEIEAFLKDAEIVEVEEIGTGITNPKKLRLRRGDKEMSAAFQTFDSDPRLERGRWGRLADSSDRYIYNLVAYRVDRMLGLEMVPPVVTRQVNGTDGAVQYWIENAINERDRKERGIPYSGHCPLKDQVNLMDVFDALIYNDDRNLTNVLYALEDWKIWLIDHSRAFRADKRLPKMYRGKLTATEELDEALESLDEGRLRAAFGEYLHEKQLDGLIARLRRLRSLR